VAYLTRFLAASPDGLTEATSIVEVKSPYSPRDVTVKEVIETKKKMILNISIRGREWYTGGFFQLMARTSLRVMEFSRLFESPKTYR
jgi:hypothetical protein